MCLEKCGAATYKWILMYRWPCEHPNTDQEKKNVRSIIRRVYIFGWGPSLSTVEKRILHTHGVAAWWKCKWKTSDGFYLSKPMYTQGFFFSLSVRIHLTSKSRATLIVWQAAYNLPGKCWFSIPPQSVSIDIKVTMLWKYARAHLINSRSPQRKEGQWRLQIYVREVFLNRAPMLDR